MHGLMKESGVPAGHKTQFYIGHMGASVAAPCPCKTWLYQRLKIIRRGHQQEAKWCDLGSAWGQLASAQPGESQLPSLRVGPSGGFPPQPSRSPAPRAPPSAGTQAPPAPDGRCADWVPSRRVPGSHTCGLLGPCSPACCGAPREGRTQARFSPSAASRLHPCLCRGRPPAGSPVQGEALASLRTRGDSHQTLGAFVAAALRARGPCANYSPAAPPRAPLKGAPPASHPVIAAPPARGGFSLRRVVGETTAQPAGAGGPRASIGSDSGRLICKEF